MTRKEAQIIVEDNSLPSFIEAADPDHAPTDDSIEWLEQVHPAMKSLEKLVKNIAKGKVKIVTRKL